MSIESTRNQTVKLALITNAPAPYRVPALRLLAEASGVALSVFYCAQPHIDTSLDAAAHGQANVHYLGGRYWAMAKRFMHCDPGIWSRLNALRPDAVITTGYIPTFLFAFLWAWWHGVAHIAMSDGTLDSERGLSVVHRLLRRFVLGRSRACVGACEGSLDLFRHYGRPEHQLFKAPLAIDNEAFAARAQSEEKVDLLFCGRFVPHKRGDFALLLAAELAQRLGREISIDFVGAGTEEGAWRELAASMTGRVRARFLGYASQHELPTRYAAARVFLFPSEWDPWGVVANEACAARVPVIVSPHAGAANELIVDGENGFVRALDLTLWADAAESLLRDEALRKQMGARGFDLLKDFSFSSAAEGIKRALSCALVRGQAQQSLVIASLMRPKGSTGVQTHVNALGDYLSKAGQSWALVTPFSGPKPVLYFLIALRRVLERVWPAAAVWLYRSGHAWLLEQALRPALAKHELCVIYAQCPVSADVALRVRKPGQRVVLVAHFNVSQADEWAGKGMIAHDGRLHKQIRSFEQGVLPRLDGLVCVSAWMLAQLRERVPALACVQQAVIPNFVADPGESDVSVTRDLIAIGTLEPRKNQGYLLEILAAANRQGVRLSLTLVGDGPDRVSLEARARELDLESQLNFAGFVPDGASLVSQHRALIHVARLENLPLTLIEGLARGKPVFAPAVGGVPEVFDDNVEGFVLPLDAPESAAHVLCEALRDQERLTQAGCAARQRFLRDFESLAVGRKLVGFLGLDAASAEQCGLSRRKSSSQE